MDLQERLSHLENVRDWQGLVEELEKSTSSGTNEEKARSHLRLGQLLEGKFLLGVKALKHFQDAYKLNPVVSESLARARSVYWDLGKLNMVQKLLELELKSTKQGARAAELLLELGDVLCDAGDYDRATATYARSLAASEGGPLAALASACLEDVQVESGSWQTHVAHLVRSAQQLPSAAKSRVLLRAARVAKRFAPDEFEGLLQAAYSADPASKQVAALYEGLLIDAGRSEDLAHVQEAVVAEIGDRPAKGQAALVFGIRWVSRHQNAEIGAKWLEQAVQLDAANEGAFQYLRELHGKKAGDWERVLGLAEEASTQPTAVDNLAFLLSQAGTIAWRSLGNLIRARASFERLKAIVPDHPMLLAFETQIGEQLVAAASASVAPPVRRSVAPIMEAETLELAAIDPATLELASAKMAAIDVEVDVAPPAPADDGAAGVAVAAPPPAEEAPPPPAPRAEEPSVEVEVEAEAPAAAPIVEHAPAAASEPVVEPPVAVEAPAVVEAPVAVAVEAPAVVEAPVAVAVEAPVAAPVVAAAPAAAPAEDVDEAKIEELRQTAAKQEAAKRYNEYVRTLLALAAAVPDPFEKVELYMKAADLYTGKFANQAEAVKAYEQVIAIDPENPTATDFLRQMYEKRRDWEKLLHLQRRDAERTYGAERAAKFLEIAKLATERVKKPEVCIELWNEVLTTDETNAEALGALALLYERSKEFDKLVSVLERQVEVTYDTAARIQILTKLGTFYGDRLNNDEGAVTAWRQLLTLDPNDRKAQEALKKKYLALGRWDDLEVFYAESGKWDEFIRVLEQQEAKETNSEAKIGLLFKIAELWADKKQKNDRAAKAYEKVLELEPTSLRAAEALIPIYTAANNSKSLANAIEVKLSHEEDDLEKVRLLREVAALYETKVKDPQRAFDRYLTAFDVAPHDEQASLDVERAAKAIAGWERVVEAYDAVVQRADDSADHDLAVALRLRLGRVHVEERKDVERALAAYRAVYEADSENPDALAALERLYRDTGKFAELLGIYEKKRDLAPTPEDKKHISYEIAKLYETELRDVDRAIDTYDAVLEEEPADGRALAALDVLYRQLERWAPYADVLRRRIELDLPEAEIVDLKYRLGSALESHLGDPAAALENYREILFLAPAHEGARLALEALLSNESLRGEAAAILEAIYEERGDWVKLIHALEILSQTDADSDKKVQLLRKIARISAESLSDRERAFDALALAVKEQPALAETRAELEQIAADSNAWPKLTALYNEVAESLTDAQLAREYWMRQANVLEHLGQIDEAAAAYGKVLALDPGDAPALAALEQLFVRTERWTDLIGVIERRIDQTTDPDAREQLYGQMAATYDQNLGRPGDAVGCWRKVLEIDSASTAALGALDALFSRQRMWSELADNLEAQLVLAQDEATQIGLMLRLAALRETEMGEIDVAIEGYRAVLERDIANPIALGALERLGADPAHELTIADLLEPLYRQTGDHAKLIGAHEVQVRRSDDPSRRVELLHQIAQLHEDAAGDLDSAFTTLARALAEDPASERTQQQIDRVARLTGRFQDLADVYERQSQASSDPALSSALLTMSAQVHERDIGSVDTAIAHYRRVLTIDPTNLNAVESLERLFRQTERYAELSKTLQRKAEIVEEIDEKKHALFQAAAIEEDVLSQPEAAILVYNALLELDPDDLRALDALVQRYLGLARWMDLLAVYARKVDLIVEPDEKKRILYQVGAVYERELGDVPRAIDTYQRILELDPDDLQALSRLDVLYEHAENWSELLSVLTRESEMCSDPAEAVGFQYRIAELYEKRLGDVPRSIELYRDILGQQADHEPTLLALEGLKAGTQEPLAAAAVLEPVYEAAGHWRALVSVHEVQVAHSQDPFLSVDLLHRIARLYEDALDEPKAAFDTFARALVFDNGNEVTLQNLERLALGLGLYASVAALYDAELEKLGDNPDRFVELGLRTAQIFELSLEDTGNAIVRFQRVLAVQPENQVALQSLDRLFSQTGRWSELAAILTREAEIAESAQEGLELTFRLGQVYELKLGSVERAIAAYREVITASPDHAGTLAALEGLFARNLMQLEVAEILEPLYTNAGEWAKLVNVHEAQLSHIPPEPVEGRLSGQEERLAAYYRIADLYEEKLFDPVQTLATYVRVLKEYPLDERAGEEAPRVAAALDGGWESLANAYADVLGLHPDDKDVQRTLGKRLAKTFEDELGDVQKAEETYKYVRTVDPLEPETLANLDRIYLSLEQWPELAEVLEARVQVPADPADLVDLYARLGEVYEVQLNDLTNATRAYKTIFDGLERTHEGAIAALGRIYESQGAWAPLNGVFERELENASGEAAEADIRAKIARLASERLNDPFRAIDTWKLVLDLRGEDPEALEALAGLYEGQQAWRELVDVLERQHDIAVSDDDRVNILTRRARVFTERLGRDDLALTDWNRVLDFDYSNLAALRAIAQIRRRQDDPTELVSALHQQVDRAAAMLDAEELKELFRELGRTYGDRLAQPYDAAEAWRKLLDVAPDLEALDALEAIYRAQEQPVDVIDVKMRRADALTDVPARIEELRGVAALWRDTVEEPDKATLAWQKVLELDEAHDEAFLELEKLHTAAARWEALIELYLARRETRTDVPERSDLLRRVAKVCEEKLEDKSAALDALVTAFEEDFHDKETSKYLERMALATGRWGEVIQRTNELLQHQTEAPQKVRLCLHLAKWYGEDLGHPEYAQPFYAQIVQLDPNNVGALRQMAQLYRKNANWQQLGATLTRALEVAVGDTDRKEILTELGELLDSQMSQTDQAVGYFIRALEVDGQFLPAIENLERIYASRGQNRELVDILHRKVTALQAPDLVAQTKLRIATLYEAMPTEGARAAQLYREVLDIEPANLQALRGLGRVYEALQQWAELVRVHEMELDVVTTERERIDLLLKVARLQEDQFLKADIAAQRLEQAVEIDPNQEDAYVALARCYRKLRQWEPLIATYERHISATIDRRTKVELYGAIAQVYSDEVADAERAIDAYRNIVDLEETNVPALEALSKLYEKTGDITQAIDSMTRVAELTPDAKQRVEAYYRIGKALDEKVGDRASAQDRYEMALDLDPSHIPSLQALRQLAMDNADYDKAARYLDQEQSYTAVPRQRARILVELGRLREEMLGEHESAVLAWESANEADPDNEDAALPLANDYVARELWAKAEPLLEMLTRKAGKRDRSEQHDLWNKLGRVQAALGKDDRALKAYSAAQQLDLTDQVTIRGLAEVCFRLRDWAGALNNFQKVLTTLGEDESDARADVYFKLGRIKREQGQAKQAINNFEKALAVDSAHRPTLDALIEVYSDIKDWKQVVAYKRQILDNVMDGNERFKMLVEIADIWNDFDKSPAKAIEALEEAKDIKPEDRPLLHKMLALYESTGSWARMIDTVQAIAEMEKDPIRKSKFIFTMAQLYRDKEGDQERAVELFNEALDLNPRDLQAFDRINKILTNQQDWKGLERAFRKMLRRLSTANVSDADLEYSLWHSLGLIYRDRQRDWSSAIEAFKMATRFKPDEALERQILAELYENTDNVEAAMGEHLIVLQKEPLRVDPYRSLYKLSLKMHDYDRAWCMCAALSFLHKADAEEQRFFEDYRPRGMIQVKSRLDNEQWVKNLFHKDDNIFIGKIFEFVTPAAILAKTTALAQAKQLPVLDKRFKQDPATSTVTFAKTFGWAAQVLGIQLPELYLRNDVPGALVTVPSRPVASVAGNTVLTGFSPQELTFIVGKHLAHYRSEHYIKTLFPTLDELKVILFSAIKIVLPDFAVPENMAQAVTATATTFMKYMQPVERDSLRLVVNRFVEDGARADLKRWMQATEITAARAGLLLCADLDIAKKIIGAEQQLPGDLPPQEKMKELLVFSVSEQYLALRKVLGIAVG